MDLQPYYNMVENNIRSLGVDPAICRGEKPGQWNLKKGSANVWIDVFYSETNKCAYYQVMSPVMEIPGNNQQNFFQELLEHNYTFYGVAFVKYQNWAYIKAIREVDGMDEKEAMAVVNRVGWYADDLDDKLKAKYGPVIHGGRG